MNEDKVSVQEDALLDTFVLFTKLFSKPFTKEALLAGLPIHDSQKLFSKDSSKSLFSRVAARAGLKSTLIKRSIEDMLSLHLHLYSVVLLCLLQQTKLCH